MRHWWADQFPSRTAWSTKTEIVEKVGLTDVFSGTHLFSRFLVIYHVDLMYACVPQVRSRDSSGQMHVKLAKIWSSWKPTSPRRAEGFYQAETEELSVARRITLCIWDAKIFGDLCDFKVRKPVLAFAMQHHGVKSSCAIEIDRRVLTCFWLLCPCCEMLHLQIISD